MHPQLAAVVREFESARARLHRLAAATPDDRWAERADPARWSVGECVAHLDLTSRAYLPLLRASLDEARTLGGGAPRRYRRDPVGWLIALLAGPLPEVGAFRLGRVRAVPAFVPTGATPRADAVAEFDALQGEQVALAEAADGLPIDRVRLTSPFDARVGYNVYACLTILPRHQRRHLRQAERVWGVGRNGA